MSSSYLLIYLLKNTLYVNLPEAQSSGLSWQSWPE